jgi:hypothetical protein
MSKHNTIKDTRVDDDEVEASMFDHRKMCRLGRNRRRRCFAAIVTAVNASPADATTGTMQFGASNDAGPTRTELISNSDYTLSVKNYRTSGFGASILGWTNQPDVIVARP